MASRQPVPLLHENGEFFARMLRSIDAATDYVLLEMYLVNSCPLTARFSEALIAARGRGVRACVLFDGFGALGFSRAGRRALSAAGVELRIFNPLMLRKRIAGNLLRDHRKLLLDRWPCRIRWWGGSYGPVRAGGQGGPWVDLMVEIAGPVVADWQRAFAQTWLALWAAAGPGRAVCAADAQGARAASP